MTSPYHKRQKQIAEVLARYEMGHLLEVLGLEGRVTHHSPGRTRPENLRFALEHLGPTFIKLGQALSIRGDLLPPDFQAELAKLQDNTTPVSLQVIEETIASELGVATSKVFASFDPEPLAAASIGQVHAATLPDGAEVVVKVRRPGASEEVELDLEILQNMAARASHRWAVAEQIDLNALMRDFAELLRAELDYLQEARNAQEFATGLAGDPRVHIPAVYPELTTTRVVTFERIRGRKITDLPGLAAAGADRHALAARFATIAAQMVLVDGFYHADPQPGNFFVEPDGRIGIVDFGRVGRIDQDLRSRLNRMLVALLRKDSDRVTSALLALRVRSGPVDREQLRREISKLLSRYGHGAHDVRVGTAISDVLDVVRHHNLAISPDLALLFAVLVMDESIAVELDPSFRFATALGPYAERHLASSLSPAALAHRVEQLGTEFADVAVELPGQLRRVLEAVGDGQFEVHLRANELRPLVRRVESLGNRLAISVLAAAVIDGLSELAAHSSRQLGWRRPVLAAAVGAVASVTAFTAWRGSSTAARLGRYGLRSH